MFVIGERLYAHPVLITTTTQQSANYTFQKLKNQWIYFELIVNEQ
jgi:hypothetical protein